MAEVARGKLVEEEVIEQAALGGSEGLRPAGQAPQMQAQSHQVRLGTALILRILGVERPELPEILGREVLRLGSEEFEHAAVHQIIGRTEQVVVAVRDESEQGRIACRLVEQKDSTERGKVAVGVLHAPRRQRRHNGLGLAPVAPIARRLAQEGERFDELGEADQTLRSHAFESLRHFRAGALATDAQQEIAEPPGRVQDRGLGLGPVPRQQSGEQPTVAPEQGHMLRIDRRGREIEVLTPEPSIGALTA